MLLLHKLSIALLLAATTTTTAVSASHSPVRPSNATSPMALGTDSAVNAAFNSVVHDLVSLVQEVKSMASALATAHVDAVTYTLPAIPTPRCLNGSSFAVTQRSTTPATLSSASGTGTVAGSTAVETAPGSRSRNGVSSAGGITAAKTAAISVLGSVARTAVTASYSTFAPRPSEHMDGSAATMVKSRCPIWIGVLVLASILLSS